MEGGSPADGKRQGKAQGAGGVPTFSFQENGSPFRKYLPSASGCQQVSEDIARSQLQFLPRAKGQGGAGSEVVAGETDLPQLLAEGSACGDTEEAKKPGEKRDDFRWRSGRYRK